MNKLVIPLVLVAFSAEAQMVPPIDRTAAVSPGYESALTQIHITAKYRAALDLARQWRHHPEKTGRSAVARPHRTCLDGDVLRILLIEDEPRMAEAIRRVLTAEHCTVDIASDGLEGLAFADQHDYDVIVLDRLLPGM